MFYKEKSFENYSKKIVLKYSIIPIFFLFFIMSLILFSNFKVKEYYKAKNTSQELSIQFSFLLETTHNSLNDFVKSTINSTDFTNSNKSMIFYNFYQNIKTLSVKPKLIILDEDNKVVLSSKNTPNIKDSFVWEDYKYKDNTYIQVVKKEFSQNEISLRLYKNITTRNKKYKIIYDIPSKDIKNILLQKSLCVNILFGKYDEIIASNNEIFIGTANKLNFDSITKNHMKFNNSNYYYQQYPIKNTHMSIMSLSYVQDISSLIFNFTIILIIVFIITIILLSFIGKTISKKSSNALNEMLLSMEHAKKGSLKSANSSNIFLEFKQLYNQYNSMLLSLNHQIKKNKQISYLNQIDQVKLLQNQLNSHFLFNILETLKYLIMFDTDKAQDMIIDLSHLLRYTIDYNDIYSNIQTEQQYWEKYLKIQKMRYQDNLNYKLNINENSKNVCIPKFLIQPIIENSIKYGYDNQKSLNIHIDVDIIGEYLVLSVLDDGCGMSENKIHDILDIFKNDIIQDNIGLANIYKKLKLLYSMINFGFDISSKEGEYTKIVIKIPKDETKCLKF